MSRENFSIYPPSYDERKIINEDMAKGKTLAIEFDRMKLDSFKDVPILFIWQLSHDILQWWYSHSEKKIWIRPFGEYCNYSQNYIFEFSMRDIRRIFVRGNLVYDLILNVNLMVNSDFMGLGCEDIKKATEHFFPKLETLTTNP